MYVAYIAIKALASKNAKVVYETGIGSIARKCSEYALSVR